MDLRTAQVADFRSASRGVRVGVEKVHPFRPAVVGRDEQKRGIRLHCQCPLDTGACVSLMSGEHLGVNCCSIATEWPAHSVI